MNLWEALRYANHLSEAHDPPRTPCYELSNCTGELGDGFRCEAVEATSTSLYECEGYRLPTEPEWEYAARAGTRTAFYSGDITVKDAMVGASSCYRDDNLDPIAWYCDNSGNSTHPVARKEPNGWGLFDVLGNAMEMTTSTPVGPISVMPTAPSMAWGICANEITHENAAPAPTRMKTTAVMSPVDFAIR